MMKTLVNLNQRVTALTEIDLVLNSIRSNRSQTRLMARLQYAVASEIDPELGRAWRDRITVRSRLRKYASKH
jgi:hypothetical protein